MVSINTQILEEIGLTQGEIKVYTALLGLGETTSGPIVKESGISVSKVYTILERLSLKGLATYIVKGKVKYFSPASPSRLLDYMNEKEENLQKQKLELENIIPQLEIMQGTTLTNETAQVYDGLKGIQAARERTLQIMKEGDEMWLIGIARTPYDNLTPYFKKYHERRIKKGIFCRYLYNDYSKDPYGMTSAKYKLSEVRYMPKGMITHSWMEIYADTVTIGLHYSKTFSVVIQNQEVADSFRNYAQLIWSIAKE